MSISACCQLWKFLSPWYLTERKRRRLTRRKRTTRAGRRGSLPVRVVTRSAVILTTRRQTSSGRNKTQGKGRTRWDCGRVSAPGTVTQTSAPTRPWVSPCHCAVNIVFLQCGYCCRVSACPCQIPGADKSLARPTSRCILFDGENISFDANLAIYTGCHRRNGPNFGRVFLMLNYTDITQNTYVPSWTVIEIMAK